MPDIRILSRICKIHQTLYGAMGDINQGRQDMQDVTLGQRRNREESLAIRGIDADLDRLFDQLSDAAKQVEFIAARAGHLMPRTQEEEDRKREGIEDA